MTWAAVACTRLSTCEPVHTSQSSFRTCTVQFTGSMVAWARKGTWYTASILWAAPESAESGAPCFRAITPGSREAASSPWTTSSVESLPFGPSSQRIVSAASPFFAAHMWSPTTATKSSRRTIWRTPGIALALVSSRLATFPPNTGLAASVAIFKPGSRTSMLNCAVPFTLLGVSSRLAGVPISVKSFGSLRVTSVGTGSVAALSASAP